MSKITNGRIEPETGKVVYIPSDEIIPFTQPLSQPNNDQPSSSVEVYNNTRVFGRNVGTDFNIFDKTVNDSSGNTILEFNTLKAGHGVELTEQSGSIVITATNDSTFVPVATRNSTGVVSVGTDLLVTNEGLLSFDRSVLNNYQLKEKDYSGYVIFPNINISSNSGFRSKLLHFVIDSEMVSGIVVGNADSSITLSEEISFTGTVYFDSGRTVCKGYLYCDTSIASPVKFLYDFIPVKNSQAEIIEVVDDEPVLVATIRIPLEGSDGEYFSIQDENDQAQIFVEYEPGMESYDISGSGASIVSVLDTNQSLQMSQMSIGLTIGNGRKLRYKINNYTFPANDMMTSYIESNTGVRTVHGCSVRSLFYDFTQLMVSDEIVMEVWDDLETQNYSTSNTNTLGLLLTDVSSSYPEYESYKIYTGGETVKVQQTLNGPLLSGTSTQQNGMLNQDIPNAIPRGIEITHLVANASMSMVMGVIFVDVFVPESNPAKANISINDTVVATNVTLSSNSTPFYSDYIVGEIDETTQFILDSIDTGEITIKIELI